MYCGLGNYTLRMTHTDDYPKIIDDNREVTHPLHKLYSYAYLLHANKTGLIICMPMLTSNSFLVINIL